MEHQGLNLLDEALEIDYYAKSWPLSGRVMLVEDSVETSGSFVLHHLLKNSLSRPFPAAVIFVAFAQPFSHYDRILRKLGCNLVVQRENNRFFFIDMLMLQCPSDVDKGKSIEDGLIALYRKIEKLTSSLAEGDKKLITIVIDDISLLEVATNGSSNSVLDFLHYCLTLTSEYGCQLIVLNHEDIYLSSERPSLLLQIEYLADILVKAQPLATGLATDVHGQLTVLNKQICNGKRSSRDTIQNFHFRIRENCVQYFYPGSRS